MGEGASTWVVGVKVWYCDGWLVDNPQKERKKQLVRCVVRQTKERKETNNNNHRFAVGLKEKKEEELASQQICNEGIDSGKQRQASKATRRYDNKTIARQSGDTATRQWIFYYGILVIMQFCENILGVSYLKKQWNEIANLSSKPTILKKLQSAAFQKRASSSFSKMQNFKVTKPNARHLTFLDNAPFCLENAEPNGSLETMLGIKIRKNNSLYFIS